MKKRWYFTLRKGTGKAAVEMYLYRKDGKFRTCHYLHTQHLFNFFMSRWYWIQFNLPAWMKRNGSMFGYKETNGTVHLRQLPDEMLN